MYMGSHSSISCRKLGEREADHYVERLLMTIQGMKRLLPPHLLCRPYPNVLAPMHMQADMHGFLVYEAWFQPFARSTTLKSTIWEPPSINGAESPLELPDGKGANNVISLTA